MRLIEKAKELMPRGLSPRERYLLALAAVLAACLLAWIYFSAQGTWDGFIQGIAANLIATLLLFSIVYYILERRGIFLSSTPMSTVAHAEFGRHDRLDWGEIIQSAATIDIVVFYYDTWVRQHHDDFVEFFRNGGKLRVVVSDPDNKGLMEIAQREFFPHQDPETMAKKIHGTFSAIRNAAQASGSVNAVATAFAFPHLLHYSFVLTNDSNLFLSVYEQFRGPTVRSPVFKISLGEDLDALTYWREARNSLISDSREIPLYPSVNTGAE